MANLCKHIKDCFCLETESLLWGLICTTAVFSYSNNMVDAYISSKWYFTLLALCFSVTFLSIWNILHNKIFKIKLTTYYKIIITISLLQSLYGLYQWTRPTLNNNHWICGSFDNPTGFAACLIGGFPFALGWKAKNKIEEKAIWMFAFIVIVTIFLSESRSGILSLTIMCLIICHKHFYLKVRRLYITIGSLFFIVCLYFLKKDSADGRLLIWKCSWEMFKEAPFLGHGLNSFRANYMKYQAEYFKQSPDSAYTILADNVLHPFNEYWHILLNWGVIGLFILIIFIVFLLRIYISNPDSNKKIAILSLIGIGIFSLFSYPLSYPFIWLIVCFDLYILLKDLFNISQHLRIYLYILAIVGGMIGSYKIIQFIHAEYCWKNIAYKTSKNSLLCYNDLYKTLDKNPYFLYNYAVFLLRIGDYGKSLEITLECQKYWSDYELELLLGNILQSQGNFHAAEIHFQEAFFMCPSRFIPLYYLMELYKKNGNLEKCQTTARLIIKKPIKINSPQIHLIKTRAKQLISEAQ